ncbi:glycosyltransferase family 4 protein [Pseudomaricurvus alkylphenolicus]|uniref:MraY family glycosyltransferase n=1 Tax=Pseudomaricurvus alkylphenolicus TaxID=1306991 RepID=UPI0014245CA6|nr:glycosyltransferase family 4 protein [Pseudomaricurvus alkylphenolicus]NIB44869.1 glycosyltransferase family 4 protein [Pseudomaricurvus alkylphenolicus]
MKTLPWDWYAGVFALTLLLSWIITGQYRRYALNRGVIDNPNERSSHTIPTPRGGGISIVLTSLLLLAAAGYWQLLDWQTSTGLILSGSLVAAIGLADDHSPLSSRWRFGVHFIASLLALSLLPTIPHLPTLWGELSLTGFALPVLTLALCWLINLYNFMDGIDGIAAAEACSVLLGASAILWLTGDHQGLWLLALTAPLLGFLIWNWAPAKIFMGDGCSGFLGLLLGVLALHFAANHEINLWSWAILLGVFIVDASWTLLTRILTGQNWHQAHRSHCYQILSRKLQSHAHVSIATALINLIWLTPLAWIASTHPDLGLFLTFSAYAPLATLCWLQKAGLEH